MTAQCGPRNVRYSFSGYIWDSGPPTEPGERYAPVGDFAGYSVSNMGRVWSCWATGGPRFIGFIQADRYRRVNLYRPRGGSVPNGNKYVTRLVHALVLEAFVGPRPGGAVARHLDGNRLNNEASNLAWGSPAENNADSERHGRVTSHKVTLALAAAIRADRRTMTYKQLTEKYDLSVMTVWAVIKGRKHDD